LSIAHSYLTFEYRNGHTVLAASHVELPLFVQRPLRGPHGEAVVVMLSPSGALFDGDRLDLQVTCAAGTDVTLTTASATKLNRCPRDDIRFDLHVEVRGGATFRYVPHELIPFRDTHYRQRISLDIDADARAWLLEVAGAGQTGAAFTYARLDFATTLRRDQQVVARERFCMSPETAGQLQGRTHYAGLFALGPEWDPTSARQVNDRLACEPLAGASTLPGGGVVARAVGDAAQSLRGRLLRAVDYPAWLTSLVPP